MAKEKGVMVDVKTTTEVAVEAPPMDWGNEGVSGSDILISKILLQQALSKFVVDGKTRPGDMVDSVTAEKLGGRDASLEIIPIMMFKEWKTSKLVGNKFEYVSKEILTPANEHLPIDFNDGKDVFRRDKVFNFYVLLARDVAKPDVIPMLISFSRMSGNAGKFLATYLAKCKMAKIPAASYVLNLACNQVTNDKGTFFVFELTNGRKTVQSELATAYKWYKTVSSSSVKVDDSEDGEAVQGAPQTESPRF